MKEVFIVSAVRTPLGSFGGSLADVSAPKLGAVAIKGAVAKAGINGEQVNEVFMGNVVSANLGQAPSRQAAIFAGLSNKVPTTDINKVCASGMKATMLGAQSIMLGLNDIVVTGGMENMSSIPYYIPSGRYGQRYGHGEFIDGLVKDGLTDVYGQMAMGVCADKTATKFNISREEQDEFAITSYKRSAASTEAGLFKNEIVPVEKAQKKGDPIVIAEDEEFKNVKFDKIPSLRAVFTTDGTVTAANASTINDGAAALVLMSGEKVAELGLKPIAKIVAFADAAHEPEWFTTAPIPATHTALKRAGLSISDIDFFEVNEAFAVVPLAYMKELGISHDKVNVHGGAVSLGHPLGCSGARVIVTLAHVLQAKGGRYGLAAICNGGGGASVIVIERV